MRKLRLPFIGSDLLYRGTLSGTFDCIYYKATNIFLAYTFLIIDKKQIE